ncbi:MAG: fused MFS/spermidine synthase [Gammaproteobacteria bacterium]|nr:fused MFS/spermidine synthase [Gammaproteobacteria bacterium]
MKPELRHPFSSLALLCAAAFCSGAGSLIYQVVWIRKVTGVTSATATATAIVVGAFMAGLACGAWLAGRNRLLFRRPLLAYALAELVAATIAVISMPLIEGAAGIMDIPLAQQLGSQTIWLPYGAIVLFLMLPATLLGMSLPLMIAHDELRESGSRFFINLVYGTNTLGAVCGCLLAGFHTIEHLGLRNSLWLGAAFATLAALAVLPMARRPAREPAGTEDAPLSIRRTLLLVALLCGWVALAAEIVWTRLVSLLVFNTVYAYTQVLAAVLIGIAAGGYLGLLFCRWAGEAATRARLVAVAVIAITLGAVLMMAVPVLLVSMPAMSISLLDLARGDSPAAILALFLVLTPPAAAIAFVLPLLALIATDQRRFQSFGDLYAVNTWGGVAGSLLAGLLLLPWLGLDTSLLLLGLVALLAAGILCLEHTKPIALAMVVIAGLIGSLGLSLGSRLPQDIYAMSLSTGDRLLDFRETELSDVMVSLDAGGERRLWINSSWVAATGGGHLSLGHLPTMFLDQRQRALGIGVGTGQTFTAVLDMGMQQLDCVEINRGVIELSQKWFSEANKNLFSRPGVQVLHNDGRAFLRTTTKRYDLVILEPLQAWSAGTTQLYTQEFYREASRRMNDGAVLAQWIPFYGQDSKATRAMVATALTVFPNASLWLDYQDGILILRKGEGTPPDWQRLDSEFSSFTAREGLMGRLESPEDMLALFQMGPAGLARWTQDAEILRDDRPFLEFAAARGVGQHFFRETLASTADFIEDPAGYFRHDESDAGEFEAAHLIRAIARASDFDEGAPRYAGQLQQLEAAMLQLPHSGLIRKRYRLAVASNLDVLRSNADKERLLLRAMEVDPGFSELSYALALLYKAENRHAEAREMERRALADPRIREALRRQAGR